MKLDPIKEIDKLAEEAKKLTEKYGNKEELTDMEIASKDINLAELIK